MLHKRGIVRKTFLFSALLIVLVVMISFTVLYFAMPRYYLFKKNQVLQTELNRLVETLKTAGSQEDGISFIASFVEENNVMVFSFDEDQKPIPALSSPFVSMQIDENDNLFKTTYQIIEGGDSSYYTVTMLDKEELQYSEDTVTDHKQQFKTVISYESANAMFLTEEVGTDLIDKIMVNGTLQPIDEAKGVILSLMPYVLTMSITVGLFLSWIYASQISKPILQISGAAEKMKNLEPDAVSGIQSKDELGLLSGNLDALYLSLRENIGNLQKEMEKVSCLEKSKTEMMQSASHELKTPIAALSGMLDGMIDNIGVYKDRDKYLMECKSQIEKLSLLVSEILNALKADNSEELEESEETSVDGLLQYALADYAVAIRKKRLHITSDLVSVSIITPPSVFYRVLANLVGNAVRHTHEDGAITITLSKEKLVIENQCESIPPEDIPKMFEPFYTRSYSRDKAESGTGLGLYIVKRNLERLGIPYRTESTQMGLKFSLFL